MLYFVQTARVASVIMLIFIPYLKETGHSFTILKKKPKHRAHSRRFLISSWSKSHFGDQARCLADRATAPAACLQHWAEPCCDAAGLKWLPQGHSTKIPLNTQVIQFQAQRHSAGWWNSRSIGVWQALSTSLVDLLVDIATLQCQEKPCYTAIANTPLSLASFFLHAFLCTFLPSIINTESKAQGFHWTELWVEGIKL